MKAFIAAFVAAALVAAFPFVPEASAQRVDTLAKIRSAKAINVAFSGDSLPFSFVASGNVPAGYSIDLCTKVIAAIGRAVGEPNLKANWLVGTVSERIAMVGSGKADLDCANTSATLGRMKDVDFSSLIFIDGGGFLVKSDRKLNRFSDLSGKKIAVITGTTTERHLDGALRKHLVSATVVPIREAGEGLALLETGGVDAFASDKVKLIGVVAQAKQPAQFAILAEDLSYEPFAFALPRNDSAFRLEVNRALSQIYASGDIETVFNQWFGKLGRPSGLLAAMYMLNVMPE